MKRIKTFFKYFLIVLILYVVTDILSFQIIKSTYIDKKLSADFESPKIEVTESKATITNGVVKGILTNDTGDTLKDKLLKLDFFSKRGVNVGTKYIDLGEVQNGDKYQFESAFNFDNVDNIKASLISKSEVPDLKLLDFSLDNIKLDKIDPFTAFFAILLVLGL